MTNLVELDLSQNGLTAIPTLAIIDCKYLMRLSFRGNKEIRQITDDAFEGLTDLNSIDFSDCGVTVIKERAFSSLKNLAYLRLESNKLTSLVPSHTFPPNLRYYYNKPVNQ